MDGATSPLLVTDSRSTDLRRSRRQEQQAFLRLYREQTGETEMDMHKVADYALAHGWHAPQPPTPRDLLAGQFSDAAREEYRQDTRTGRPYRAYHAYSQQQGEGQLFLWVDIDEATRPQMQRSVTNRRDQIIGDVFQLTLDADHWNSINPAERPLMVVPNFADDIEERKYGVGA
jgi:hypothetical protein